MDLANGNGSGISLSHRVGATGAIMTVKLKEEMESRDDGVSLGGIKIEVTLEVEPE